MQRRVAIASFYDEKGIVDDYVIFLLKELRGFTENIIFVSNGALSKNSEIAVKQHVDTLITRNNEGFDVGAYRAGLEAIGFDELANYDELILFNHTFYGPIFPFSEMFETMEARECDFWGITAHNRLDLNPLTGKGELSYHLQSYFIAIRRQMAASTTFRHYWATMKPIHSCEDSIVHHKTSFTKYFSDLGYVHSVYIDMNEYGSHYPAFVDVDETVKNRCPILMRRIFFHDPLYNDENAVDLPRALAILKKESRYDESLIWKNILRSSRLRDLNATASLMSVFPDVRLKPENAPMDYGRIAVCAHVYYVDMLDELFSLTANIPVPYDFIATTDTPAKKAEIERAFANRSEIGTVIVRVMEENRGRDMSALFVTCRDLFLANRYDIVCRIHTKKTPHVKQSQSNLFKRHMVENLLGSPGYVSNVLDMFGDAPWIGLALPPVVQIGFGTLGQSWYGNQARAEEIKTLLNLNVTFDPHTPVAAYGGMFWFRPAALRKLFLRRWKFSDFEPEPYPVEGSFGHALERVIAYVAQDAGYTTQHIMSTAQAAWNYTMLELKLDRLQSKLPFGQFVYHVNLLSEWQKHGYPMGSA